MLQPVVNIARAHSLSLGIKLMRNKIAPLLLLLSTVFSYAQEGIAIGQWRTHLPYNSGLGVVVLEEKIITAAQDAMFVYDSEDESLRRFSKVHGLSDVGISAIAGLPDQGLVIAGYASGIVDIIDGSRVQGLFAISQFNIIGSKRINHILVLEDRAFFSCDFGVVEFDAVKLEFDGPYYIGENGQSLVVHEMSYDGQMLYAATDDGILQADIDAPNLKDFNSWSMVPGIQGWISSLEYYDGKLYALKKQDGFNLDSLLYRENGTWNFFSEAGNFSMNKISSSGGMLTVCNYFSAIGYYSDGTTGFQLTQSVVPYEMEPQDAVVDGDIVWIADGQTGLIKHFDGWKARPIIPNSTNTNRVYDLASGKGSVWVAPGGRSGSWGNEFFREDLQFFIEESWDYVAWEEMDSIFDAVVIEKNPHNGNVLVGSWGRGLLEFDAEGNLLGRYDYLNSPLQENPLNPGWTGISGLEVDERGIVWMVNSNTEEPLVLRFADGSGWKGFRLGNLADISLPLGKLMIDNQGQKWIQLRNDGLIVYNDNGTPANENDDQFRKITSGEGSGNLSSLSVLSFDVDQNGYVWVGTGDGVSTFYSPSRIFSGQNFDAVQVLVEVDGYLARLLENEQVTAVKVDPGNRKWFGTASSGVFLMSPDGTEQILHFDKDNSPLLSNTILDIEIIEETGEVFFGTSAGMISYKADATTGGDSFGHVYAYPNPVEPGYEGVIAVKGLVNDANVKITDISGNVVFETQSEGGQAVWDGYSLGGYKVSTGVYLVFITNDDGSQTEVTKILIVN
jgi:hypothetical protein